MAQGQVEREGGAWSQRDQDMRGVSGWAEAAAARGSCPFPRLAALGQSRVSAVLHRYKPVTGTGPVLTAMCGPTTLRPGQSSPSRPVLSAW